MNMWCLTVGCVTNLVRLIEPVTLVMKRRNSCYVLLLLLLLGLTSLNSADSVVHTGTGDVHGLFLSTQTSSPPDSELSYLADVTSSSSHARPRSSSHDDYHHQPSFDHQAPAFDNDTTNNVTAEISTLAYLNCRVRHLGDKVVSWVRRRDFHILTVGLHTYTSDQRFQMLHQEHTDDWTLQIRYAQARDTGIYECQVSSDPPISHFVTLNVVVAKASISGPPDLYFKSGSTITLTCVISQSPDTPSYVFWFHDSRMINYDTSRGGIAVKTIKGDTTVSTLVISNAQKSDSGNYTCDPTNAEPTHVLVHVLNGEKPEAIQHDAKTSSSGQSNTATALGSCCISQSLMFGCVLLVSLKILFCCCCCSR